MLENRKDITKNSDGELGLIVMNDEPLYNLAQDTEGWTNPIAIKILKDKIRDTFIYNIDQMIALEKTIVNDWSPGLDLGDINDPMPDNLIDTSFGTVHKDYPMEPDFDTVEDKIEYLYGRQDDVE